jgi:hypothetical protein
LDALLAIRSQREGRKDDVAKARKDNELIRFYDLSNDFLRNS